MSEPLEVGDIVQSLHVVHNPLPPVLQEALLATFPRLHNLPMSYVSHDGRVAVSLSWTGQGQCGFCECPHDVPTLTLTAYRLVEPAGREWEVVLVTDTRLNVLDDERNWLEAAKMVTALIYYDAAVGKPRVVIEPWGPLVSTMHSCDGQLSFTQSTDTNDILHMTQKACQFKPTVIRIRVDNRGRDEMMREGVGGLVAEVFATKPMTSQEIASALVSVAKLWAQTDESKQIVRTHAWPTRRITPARLFTVLFLEAAPELRSILRGHGILGVLTRSFPQGDIPQLAADTVLVGAAYAKEELVTQQAGDDEVHDDTAVMPTMLAEATSRHPYYIQPSKN